MKTKLTYFRIFLMMLGVFFIHQNIANAQLLVRSEKNFTKMVRQSFVGPGIAIKNVIFRGDSAAIGIFDGRNSNIGLDSGILITTGKAVDAIGPDNMIASSTHNPTRTDGDLNSLLSGGQSTVDASYLQFTFTPSSSKATFKFVFASEEYENFVGFPFNDIFGFFISGPGITGKKNLALVPGKTDPVSVNTVNQNVNSNLFVNNIGGLTIQYNGFTKVIEVTADNLTICEDYILKLVIADVEDNVYDSGIFLASLDSEAPNNAFVSRIAPPKSLNKIKERCDSSVFRFTRSNTTDLSKNYTVKYDVLGAATRGIDFIDILDSIVIPAGQAFKDLEITPITDNLIENLESVVLRVTNNVVCAESIDSILIADFDTIKITSFIDVRCTGDTLFKQVKYSGGSSQLSFLWTDSLGTIKGASSILTASQDSLTMYIITIFDSCINYTVKDTIYIPPITIVNLVIPDDTVVCAPVDIHFYIQSNIPGLKYSWTAEDPGMNSIGLFDDNTIQNPIYSVPSGVNAIKVTVKVDSPSFCSEILSFMIRVIPKGIYGAKTVYVCKGDSTTLKAYGGGTYKWSPSNGIVGDTTTQSIVVYKPGIYKAAITDTINCLKEYTVTVVYDTIPHANAGPDYIICERTSIQLEASGSDYPNQYEWSPATGLTNTRIKNPIASPLVTTTYVVKVNNNACFSYDTMTINVIKKPNNLVEYVWDSCSKVISFINNTIETDSFYWDFGDGDFSLERNPLHKYDTTGTILVKMLTNRGTDCMDTTEISLNLIDVDPSKRVIPNAFSPNGDGKNDVFKITGGNVNCKIEQISIFNRWGKKLHEIKGVDVWEWDGKIGNEIVPQGVYFYSIKGEGFEDVGMVNVLY